MTQKCNNCRDRTGNYIIITSSTVYIQLFFSNHNYCDKTGSCLPEPIATFLDKELATLGGATEVASSSARGDPPKLSCTEGQKKTSTVGKTIVSIFIYGI